MKPFNQLIAELEVARSLLHERIKNGLSKKVAKFYDDMIADLQAQILKKKNITNNLAQTISDLKQSLKTPDLRKDFLTLAQNEQDHLLDYNELAGFNLFSSVLPEASIERLVDSAQLEGATVKAWNNGLNADQKKRLERELKIGVSLGETTPMLAQRIAHVLEKNKRDATAIALTGAGAIVSEIRQAFFEANDDVIKCYKYQATLDTRTSELCRAYDGLTWDKDYKPIGHNFPFRKPRVNTHFNCRSTIIPVTKSWDELGIEGMDSANDRTRSSMNGYVPQDMTFNDWLKTQSPETIEKTLGKGRAELFMQGKITMRDLITQQGRVLDLGELAKKKSVWEYSKESIKHFEVPKELKRQIKLNTDKIRGSIKYLYEHHKGDGMFKDENEVKAIIADVLKNYDYIKPSSRKGGFIIAKALNGDKNKMIDIGINPTDGVIFHVNKKRWDSDMKAFQKNR
nr:MAG TPA: minor capsid protein [Caudoviricetes sp.]